MDSNLKNVLVLTLLLVPIQIIIQIEIKRINKKISVLTVLLLLFIEAFYKVDALINYNQRLIYKLNI